MPKSLVFLFALSTLLSVGCTSPKPVPPKAIQVQVSSSPGPAVLLMAGRPIGQTPQALSVNSADELLQISATLGQEMAVEKRIRFLSLDRAEVVFVFGTNHSALAKALGLARILVFDYGAGVSFDVNRATLKPEFLPLLERQAALLKTHFADQNVFICGHTDAQGTATYNLSLSMDRARSVADFLAAKGAAKARMKTEGFGSTYPVTENDTEQGRALNRRTEVVLLQ